MTKAIDINADLGEGFLYDAQLMPMISSCNIACGGHFGDTVSMRKTIRLAKKHHVKVGAHPSFPDTENFGRKVMEIEENILFESLIKQMNDFFNICKEENVRINHIKPHGALYNLSATDEKINQLVLRAIEAVTTTTTIYHPSKSLFTETIQEKFTLKLEAFIDRSYTDNGQLAPRSLPNALIVSPQKCLLQLVEMVTKNQVTSINGAKVPLYAETFCIHGDNEHSLDILHYIHQHLKEHNIQVA